MDKRLEPIVRRTKVVSVGGSKYISLPPDWFRAHNIDPNTAELLTVADKDVTIINPDPENERKVYNRVTGQSLIEEKTVKCIVGDSIILLSVPSKAKLEVSDILEALEAKLKAEEGSK